MEERFHDKLRKTMDDFAHLVYGITKSFPQEELYGITSQLRRASLSIILNYIEGYARFKPAVQKHFLVMSYGSLKEVKYLLHFSYKETYIQKFDYKKLISQLDEIGAMLWSTIQGLNEKK